MERSITAERLANELDDIIADRGVAPRVLRLDNGPEMIAAALAAGLTVLITLAVKASQPAAVSTSLLIALGVLQRWQDAFVIMGAVVLMLIFGEPLRLWRLRERSKSSREVFKKAA